MDFFFIIGTVLVFWCVYDLFSEKVMLHREIFLEYFPRLYWSLWTLFLILGLKLTITNI